MIFVYLWDLLDAVRNVTTWNKEKAEVLNALFTSAFNRQISYPQGTLHPDLEVQDATQNTPPVIQVETVRELLLHVDCHKSMGPDGLHPRVLRELAGVIANRSQPSTNAPRYLERSQRIGGLPIRLLFKGGT